MNGVGYGITPFMGASGILARSSGGGGVPFVNEYSMSLDGVDEYFTGASTFSELDGGTKLSLSIWIKPISGSPLLEYVLSNPRDTTANNSQFALVLYEGLSISFNIQSRTSQFVSGRIGAITYGAWNHILVCVDLDATIGTEGVIFINGVDETTSSNMGTLTQFYNASGVLYVGEEANGGFNPFNGNIDELAIWVNSDQRANVSDIYNGGVPFDLSTLATAPSHWWRMGDNDTWSGSQWTLTDNIGSYDLNSVNMEEADRLPISPNSYSQNSFNFDGVDEYLTAGNPSSLQITGALTLSAWVKIASSGGQSQQCIISKNNGSTQRSFVLWAYTSFLTSPIAYIYSGASNYSVQATTNIRDGFWHHVMLVYTPSTSLNIYVDGVLEGSNTTSIPSSINNATQNFEIGRFGSGTFQVFGNIDEVAVWNNDQSSNISTIFNNGVPTDISSLSPLSHWRMGESATWNGSQWTLTDQGSGGNNATSVNMEEADKTGDQAYVL